MGETRMPRRFKLAIALPNKLHQRTRGVCCPWGAASTAKVPKWGAPSTALPLVGEGAWAFYWVGAGFALPKLPRVAPSLAHAAQMLGGISDLGLTDGHWQWRDEVV